jgi:outer membrane protein assembly factor BamB
MAQLAAASLALAGLSSAGAATSTSSTTQAASSSTAWTVYHGNAQGEGVAASISSVDLHSRAWTSPALDGQLFGEPLSAAGRVFVATENDTVYALSAASGVVEWSSHLGSPVPSASLPCGDISPSVGITGTPVVDAGRSEIFVVSDMLAGGVPVHRLIGLDTRSGRTELSQDVDPAAADPAALLQRTGLTLDAGRVVFGFGGNFGDCSTYRGWVMAVPEAGGAPSTFAVDSGPGESQGAIWMGGAAPVVDGTGNVWVEAGNGSVTSPRHAYDDSDSVLELSPSLTLLHFFAPSSWASDNSQDLDLSTAPALLADGQVIAAGKGRIAYLLNASDLGGIGGQVALLPGVCGQDVAGGVAVQGAIVFLPCASGTVAIEATAAPAGLRLLWRASAGGGPPILAAGTVWSIGQDGTLYGLNPSTGAVEERADVGPPANHFPTPSIGDGLLLAPGAERVVAFSAPSSAPSSAPTPTTTTTTTTLAAPTTTHAAPAAPQGPAGAGGLGPGALAAIALGALVVVVGLSWLLLRARRAGGRVR